MPPETEDQIETKRTASAAPVSHLQAARAALGAWESEYCTDSVIARNTDQLNAIRQHLSGIAQVLNAIKEE